MLDEQGEDIIGTWNFTADKMDPYIEGEEEAAIVERDRMLAEEARLEAEEAALEAEEVAAALKAATTTTFVFDEKGMLKNKTTATGPTAAGVVAAEAADEAEEPSADGAAAGAVAKDLSADVAEKDE